MPGISALKCTVGVSFESLKKQVPQYQSEKLDYCVAALSPNSQKTVTLMPKLFTAMHNKENVGKLKVVYTV